MQSAKMFHGMNMSKLIARITKTTWIIVFGTVGELTKRNKDDNDEMKEN